MLDLDFKDEIIPNKYEYKFYFRPLVPQDILEKRDANG